MKQRSILIFTATYNEADNIERFCGEVLSANPDADLLVVDDRSPDGTGAILEKLAAADSRIKYLPRPHKGGLGTAHQLAMIYAIRNGYSTLVTMDADFSHQPEEIPNLLKALEGADFVIGSRYCKGGSCSYTGYRKYVSLAANFAARLLLGCNLREFTTSFRVFRVSLIESMGLLDLRYVGYSFFLSCVYRIYAGGWKIREVPIQFLDRTAGASKLPKFEAVVGTTTLLRLAIRRVFPKRTPQLGLSPTPCYECGDLYCVKYYPRSGTPSVEAEAYRCTSLDHHSKPETVKCLRCGLQFVPHRPEVEPYYASVVDDTYLRVKHARFKTFESTYQKIAPFLPDDPKVLEVGSYCGLFLETLRRHGLTQMEGIEPSQWASDYARRELGLNVRTGSLGDFQHSLKGYDVVAMWDVLEHLTDPMGALGALNGALRKDGLLCFSTLDVDNWFPRLLRSHWPWRMEMHLFYFSTKVIRDLLEKNGFELVSAQKYSHYISVRYLGEKLFALSPIPVPRWIQRLFLVLAPQFLLIPFSFGDVKLYVARKVADRAQEVEAAPKKAAGLGR